MKRILSLVLIITLISGITGCTRKVDEGKLPITTLSDDARKEFLEGRSIAEKLQFTNSIQHFDKAIALDSGFALAYLNRALNSFIAKDLFFYLKKAVALKDNCSRGERLLILAIESATNGNTVNQKKYLDTLILLYPDDERIRFNMGGFYFGQQDYTNAIEQYRKAIEIAPEYSPAYNILGYAYRQIENFQEAENSFRKYIKLLPNDPNPYDSYAELLMKTGRFDESIINYRKALETDPGFVASHIGIATNFMYKGIIDSGLAQLDKLTQIARHDGEKRQAYFTKMILFVDAGKIDLALQELEKQIALGEKTNNIAAVAGDYGLKGAILLENGKLNDALKAYEKSEQLIASSDLSKERKANSHLLLNYNRASVALAKKDIMKAIADTKIFRMGAEFNDNFNQIQLAHELTGRVAYTDKKYDMAIEELLQSNLQNPYNLYRLALCYKEKGNKEKAKEFCSKAIKFNGLPALNYAFIRNKAKQFFETI